MRAIAVTAGIIGGLAGLLVGVWVGRATTAVPVAPDPAAMTTGHVAPPDINPPALDAAAEAYCREARAHGRNAGWHRAGDVLVLQAETRKGEGADDLRRCILRRLGGPRADGALRVQVVSRDGEVLAERVAP